MDRIFQEFYCAKSGGGCGGYILVEINSELTCVVEVICPKCRHAHQRSINKGRIVEQGRYNINGKPQERLLPLITAWSKHPRTRAAFKMQKAIDKSKSANERDAHIICNPKRDFLKDRWFEIHGVTPP